MSIKFKLFGSVFLLSLTITSIFFVTWWITEKQRDDGLVINLAGRQRMLTQKMTKEVLHFQSVFRDTGKKDPAVVNQVQNTMRVFDETLRALTYSGKAPLSTDLNKAQYRYCPKAQGPAYTQLIEVHKMWKEFSGNIKYIIHKQPNDREKTRWIVEKNLILLAAMNKAVETMQKQSEKKVYYLLSAHMIGVIIGVTFALIAFFVMVSITKNLSKLTRTTSKIICGDLGAKVNIVSRDEVGSLASSFNKMTEELNKTTVSINYVNNIIETMTDMLIVLTPNCTINTLNQATCDVLGYRRNELIGQPIEKIIEEENSIFSGTNVSELLDSVTVSAMETAYYKKNGDKVHLLLSGSIMRNRNGNIQGIVCVAKDISDIKKAKEEREELIDELSRALEKVRLLKGLLPICAKCKKIRDDNGYWHLIENYIEKHSEVLFSHGICPDCSKIMYGKQSWYQKKHGA